MIAGQSALKASAVQINEQPIQEDSQLWGGHALAMILSLNEGCWHPFLSKRLFHLARPCTQRGNRMDRNRSQ